MPDKVDAEREAFEEAAFLQYFLSTITRNPNPPRGTGALDLVSKGCKTKAEFVERGEDGQYKTETLNPAWWAWQERANADKAEAIVSFLEMHDVQVRTPLRYGSRELFWAYVDKDEEEPLGPSNLREQVEAGIAKERSATATA